jgi:ribosomal protein S18 acetylase RimI-like enzyme
MRSSNSAVLTVFDSVPGAGLLDGCVAVYRAAFGAPPYREPPEQADELRARIERYADREGFALPVFQQGDAGPVRAFALAAVAHEGDWWRDAVAAFVGPEITERWLGESVLEIVHVAVAPVAQRSGIGRQMLDALVAGTSAPTAALSVDPRAEDAQWFYLATGWTPISTRVRTAPASAPTWLMGKDVVHA